MRRNVANQRLFFQLLNASGASVTGASVTPYVTLDGGAQGPAAGTVGELALGQYRFNPTDADTDGDFIGYLFTATGALPVSANIYTGLSTDVAAISPVAVGASLNVRSTSDTTIDQGTAVGGSTYLDTYDLNQTYFRIQKTVGNQIEVTFEFNVGADYIPVSTTVIGRMSGQGNVAAMQAYHWEDQLFRQVGSLAGNNQDQTVTATLFLAHVGTGADAGRVRVKFILEGVSGNNDLYVDQLWVSYAPAGAFNSTDRANVVAINDKTSNLPADPASETSIAALPDAAANAQAVWQRALEAGMSAEEFQRVILAALAGKRQGLGAGTEKYYDRAGTKPRITFTPDHTGSGTPIVDGTT